MWLFYALRTLKTKHDLLDKKSYLTAFYQIYESFKIAFFDLKFKIYQTAIIMDDLLVHRFWPRFWL